MTGLVYLLGRRPYNLEKTTFLTTTKGMYSCKINPYPFVIKRLLPLKTSTEKIFLFHRPPIITTAVDVVNLNTYLHEILLPSLFYLLFTQYQRPKKQAQSLESDVAKVC